MGLKCTKNWLCGSYCHEKFGFVVSQKPSLADGSPSARWALYQVYCLLAEVQSAEKEAVAVETAAEAMDGAAAHVNEPLDGTSKMPGRHFEDGSSLDAHGAVERHSAWRCKRRRICIDCINADACIHVSSLHCVKFS